ncbi:hypothetical protein NQ317_011974 [Molorchus minor]|uniref:Uncharacterized protein n=1 Tax=Molorchus minor TaxID=1323400 RepID=A0ABQ9IU05_9CUCU|nr:hypothetical protein NQ317_011974 [Molorchus minor]
MSVPPDILNEDTSGDMSISEGENATLLCKGGRSPHPQDNVEAGGRPTDTRQEGSSGLLQSTKCYNRQTIFPKILSASSEPGNTTRKACPSAS